MIVHGHLRERVFEAHKAIVRAGLVILTFGNVSAVDREAGVMAIKPSGVPYDELTPASVVVVDLVTGEVVDGRNVPSSDTPTHLVLYCAFDGVGGIVHTHSPAATSWAQARRDLPCLGTTHADHFCGDVPRTRPLTDDEINGPYEVRTGEVIVETFNTRELDPLANPAALVAFHGPFAWGPTVEQAVENAVALEVVATIALDTLRLDPGTPSAPQALVDRHHQRKHGPAAYYGQSN